MKRLILSLVLVAAANCALAGGVVNGSIGLRLVILPTNGCSGELCVVDTHKAVEDMQHGKQAKDFNISQQGNLITFAF